MLKTTVYLTEAEADGLRRVAATTGRSKAVLIREGMQAVIWQGPPRIFHSMGEGEVPGESRPRWRSDELYHRVFGATAGTEVRR